MSTSRVNCRRVAVLGATGGIGQPLSLLLKQSPLVTHLSLFDIRGAPGVATDLSHIDTSCKVVGFGPEQGLDAALKDAEIVLIPAGVPRKPGMTRDDLFEKNASVVRDMIQGVAKVCPKAMIGVISNPVNSTVPIAAEVLKKAGKYDAKRLFGVTTLDVLRASTFVGESAGTRPEDVVVPVVGGHAGTTIIPLLSQNKDGAKLKGQARLDMVKRIQFGGDEVVKAKDGTGSATLSMAVAAQIWTQNIIRAMNGEKGIVMPTFIESPHYKASGVPFFATNVRVGANGVEEIMSVGKVTQDEQALIDAALPDLKAQADKGIKFITG